MAKALQPGPGSTEPAAYPSAEEDRRDLARARRGVSFSGIFKCLHCLSALSEVYLRNGRTALKMTYLNGDVVWIDRAEFECGNCGTARKFYGEPLSALTLGLAEDPTA